MESGSAFRRGVDGLLELRRVDGDYELLDVPGVHDDRRRLAHRIEQLLEALLVELVPLGFYDLPLPRLELERLLILPVDEANDVEAALRLNRLGGLALPLHCRGPLRDRD